MSVHEADPDDRCGVLPFIDGTVTVSIAVETKEV
jgi:hypothetical protein